MFLKVVRIFIVLVVLFSYLPIVHVDFCANEDHEDGMDHVKINCGYVFHCPFVSNNSFLGSITILNIGRLVLMTSSPLVEDLEYPIFHPPETSRKSPFVS
jgi:hypothetical protein